MHFLIIHFGSQYNLLWLMLALVCILQLPSILMDYFKLVSFLCENYLELTFLYTTRVQPNQGFYLPHSNGEFDYFLWQII